MSRAAVVHWVETMFKSMGEGDFDAFCNHCSDDVTLYPPDSRPLYGIEAMKKLTRPWFENYNMSHEITEITAKVDQSLAYAFAEYVDTISPKRGGKDTVTPNKAIYILRRGQGNIWKATDIMWNRNPRE